MAQSTSRACWSHGAISFWAAAQRTSNWLQPSDAVQADDTDGQAARAVEQRQLEQSKQQAVQERLSQFTEDPDSQPLGGAAAAGHISGLDAAAGGRSQPLAGQKGQPSSSGVTGGRKAVSPSTADGGGTAAASGRADSAGRVPVAVPAGLPEAGEATRDAAAAAYIAGVLAAPGAGGAAAGAVPLEGHPGRSNQRALARGQWHLGPLTAQSSLSGDGWIVR